MTPGAPADALAPVRDAEPAASPATVSPPGAPPAHPSPPAERPLRALVELPVLLVLAGVIAFLVKTFTAQAFYIPSESMVPQLRIDDRVVVSKLAYHLHAPRRGDILVFDCPPRASCRPGQSGGSTVGRAIRFVGTRVGLVQPSTDEYIKRVIALAGERVEGHDGHVFIAGRLLVEPYLPPDVRTSDFPAQVVPPGHLWVMGDNRAHSFDSRYFGTIERSHVVGRAIVKVWPARHASFL